jgi:hypothetical protein
MLSVGCRLSRVFGCSTMVTIEGIKVNAKTIPKRQLLAEWKTLTDQPFPKMKAFQLKDGDFNRVMRFRRCREDEVREVIEWSRVLTAKGTDACVFNADESAGLEYIILIREKPYHSLHEIIKHELAHVAGGDL